MITKFIRVENTNPHHAWDSVLSTMWVLITNYPLCISRMDKVFESTKDDFLVIEGISFRSRSIFFWDPLEGDCWVSGRRRPNLGCP